MQEPEEKRVRRSQRDYSLAFKLAVVGEVARGELSKKQAQRRDRQARQLARAAQVLVEVRAERALLPRLGTRKLLHKISPRLRARGVACGRDALFTLLRSQQLLGAKKRSFTKTTDSHHRFRQHPNLVNDAPKPTAPNQRYVSDLIIPVVGCYRARAKVPHRQAVWYWS